MTNSPLQKTISYALAIRSMSSLPLRTGAHSLTCASNVDDCLAQCYASFHMQKRMSCQCRSTVMPCTGCSGSDDVGEGGGCVAAAGKSWETVQLTSRHARALWERQTDDVIAARPGEC